MEYATTKEQNELLTQVGPGTRMGKLLRLYWWPVGISADLKEKPTLVRLMGEDLVLFRDTAGKLGLLAAQCPHRRAQLCLGTVNPKGLRCRYHGWLFDAAGTVLETPGEAAGSGLKNRVKQPAYVAREIGGLIFAYLGPQPAPLLPNYHFLAAEGERTCRIQSFNNSNWLQSAENGIDPFHVSFLHADVWSALSPVPEQAWFEKTDKGIVYKALRAGRKEGEYNYREQPMIMPGVVVNGDPNVAEGADGRVAQWPIASARWSVPIDDTHTMNVRVHYRPKGQSKSRIEQQSTPAVAIPIEPYHEYKHGLPAIGYTMVSEVAQEDVTILDSLGTVSDRQNENLSDIDGGVVRLRQMLLDQLAVMESGKDPLGVIRRAEDNPIQIVGGNYRWVREGERDKLLETV
jgi:5,5'-dehydrodivanillate O-demethylase